MSALVLPRALFFSAALLAAFAAPAAQSRPDSAASRPARETITGSVVDADGTPAGRAAVKLAWLPFRACADHGVTDLVETITAADGTFAAALLPCRPYAAWATRGRREITQLAEDIVPGDAVRLRLGSRPGTRVNLSGREAWRDAEPLRCEVTAGTSIDTTGYGAAVLAAPVGADGTVYLGHVPGWHGRLVVRTARGLAIGAALVPRGQGGRRPGHPLLRAARAERSQRDRAPRGAVLRVQQRRGLAHAARPVADALGLERREIPGEATVHGACWPATPCRRACVRMSIKAEGYDLDHVFNAEIWPDDR